MITTIKAQNLRVGMFVVLPLSWFKHPFLKNQFLISSKDQIDKIQKSGLKEVKIDTSRGKPVEDVASLSHETPIQKPPEKWEPEKNINSELKEVISDKNMPPDKKAKVVYKSSLEVMNKLFANPTADVIGDTKKVVFQIVDLILSDDDTALNLLKITSHDFYTYTHSVNVGVLAISLSKKLYKDSASHNMHELGAGFFLHDLGKVRVDPAIINKPGRLNDEEMYQMRIHPYQSYKILKETNYLTEEAEVIAMQHHEREDGTGYPKRLMADQISDYGRICCIADVYDALTAERSYKKGVQPFEALKIMKEEMLGSFHKEIFDNFVLLFK